VPLGEDDWLARCGEPWTERYEDLRCQALKESVVAREAGRGLALFLRHGLVSWMQAWPRAPATSARESSPAAEAPTIEFSSPQGRELAHILAAVVLQRRQEVLS
jgi:hypothetical protein